MYGAPSAASIYLSWTKGAGSTNTVIRYSYSDYPTAVTEGIALYSGASTGYEHTGLTPARINIIQYGVNQAEYIQLVMLHCLLPQRFNGGDGAIDQPESTRRLVSDSR